jgi:elongation factor P
MLTSEIKVYLTIYEEQVIGVILPPKVRMTVAEAQDAVAGDRQTAGKKPVVMESGLIVQAPLFIKSGDTLLIDTETAAYVSRVND